MAEGVNRDWAEDMEKERVRLRAEVERLRDKCNDHDSAAQAHKERADFLRDEVERLKEELHTTIESIKMHVEESNTLKAELAEAHNVAHLAEQRYAECLEHNAELKAENADLRKCIEEHAKSIFGQENAALKAKLELCGQCWLAISHGCVCPALQKEDGK